MTTEDSITAEELANGLEIIGYISGHDSLGRPSVFHVTRPSGIAALIFRLAIAEREPEYQNGAVYSDAQQELWLYDRQRRGWWAFADSTPYEFESPRRPLVKLVPEYAPPEDDEDLREP